MSGQTHVQFPEEALAVFCRRYHVRRRLAIFGSVLRGDFGPESEVDVLVELEPGRTPGLGFVRLQREICELLGHEVDLHTYRSLSRYFRDDVLRNELLNRITIESGKCGGRPCIRGMRIRVQDILDMLAAGASEEEILRDYPYLERDDIRAALAYSAAYLDHGVIVAKTV